MLVLYFRKLVVTFPYIFRYYKSCDTYNSRTLFSTAVISLLAWTELGQTYTIFMSLRNLVIILFDTIFIFSYYAHSHCKIEWGKWGVDQ